LYVKEADSSREVAVGQGEYSSVIAVQSGERNPQLVFWIRNWNTVRRRKGCDL